MEKINKYLIEGFEWFDKINGNSYHTIKITDLNENKVIVKSKDIVYGYGNQYEHTAYKELINLGLAKKEDEYNHELNHKRFVFRKQENMLKREILNI
tara:strand:- start:24 stop:314 length:291 start_codon:yes stop_codon:yes gene_type:complete